jgi:hypothetical protein
LLDSNQKSDKNSAGEGRMDAGGGVIVVVGSEIWKAEACNNAALFFSSSFLLNPSLTAVRFFLFVSWWGHLERQQADDT